MLLSISILIGNTHLMTSRWESTKENELLCCISIYTRVSVMSFISELLGPEANPVNKGGELHGVIVFEG